MVCLYCFASSEAPRIRFGVDFDEKRAESAFDLSICEEVQAHRIDLSNSIGLL